MKIIKLENLVYLISIIILSIAMYGEFIIKKDIYVTEKIDDIKSEYKNIIDNNNKIVKAM